MVEDNKKVNNEEVTPQYAVVCGNSVRRCCSANPDCYTEIQVFPDGTRHETGSCCSY